MHCYVSSWCIGNIGVWYARWGPLLPQLKVPEATHDPLLMIASGVRNAWWTIELLLHWLPWSKPLQNSLPSLGYAQWLLNITWWGKYAAASNTPREWLCETCTSSILAAHHKLTASLANPTMTHGFLPGPTSIQGGTTIISECILLAKHLSVVHT